MQYTESRVHNSSIDQAAKGLRPLQPPTTLHPPTKRLAILARVARVRLSLALAAPALCGLALAWWHQDSVQVLPLIFTLISVFASTFSLSLLTEYNDYRRSFILNDPHTQPQPMTGYELLVNGRIAPGLVRSLGGFLLTLSFLSSAWLALLVGWPMLFFSGLSLLLTSMHMLPPLRYAYRGWLLGEIGIFLNYGLLHLLAAYYAQANTLTADALWAAIPLGLLVTLCAYNYNFLHHHRDWLIQKRTLVVKLGAMRAVDISIVLTIAAYVSLLLIAAFALLPLRILVTLATLPTAISAFSTIDRETMNPEDGFAVVRSSTSATLWTALFFSIVLLLFA